MFYEEKLGPKMNFENLKNIKNKDELIEYLKRN